MLSETWNSNGFEEGIDVTGIERKKAELSCSIAILNLHVVLLLTVAVHFRQQENAEMFSPAQR